MGHLAQFIYSCVKFTLFSKQFKNNTYIDEMVYFFFLVMAYLGLMLDYIFIITPEATDRRMKSIRVSLLQGIQ